MAIFQPAALGQPSVHIPGRVAYVKLLCKIRCVLSWGLAKRFFAMYVLNDPKPPQQAIYLLAGNLGNAGALSIGESMYGQGLQGY